MFYVPPFVRRRFGSLAILAALSVLVLLPNREARALVPFMDGGIFINAEAIASYDTNVFANANEEDDFYLTLIPELQYTRTAGVLHLDLRLGMEVQRFMDLSDQDTEDLFAGIELTHFNHPGGHPMRIEFGIDWRETTSIRETLGVRATSEMLDATLLVRKQVSDRLALRGVAGYEQETFDQSAFSEIETWMARVDGIHIYSDNLETFLGYRYRHTDTEGVTRRSLGIGDHLLHVGAEGQLSARTTGIVTVGIQQRTFDESDLSDTTEPYWSVSGIWTPRSRTQITVLAMKDFTVTPDDRSVDRMMLRLALNQGVYGGFSVEPMISYTTVDLDRQNGASRKDKRYEAGVGLLYDFAGDASAALRYSYSNQDSDNTFLDYTRHLIELSVLVTF